MKLFTVCVYQNITIVIIEVQLIKLVVIPFVSPRCCVYLSCFRLYLSLFAYSVHVMAESLADSQVSENISI